MNICVCSLAIGEEYKKTVYWCVKSLEIYCKLNNYKLINTGDFKIEDRECQWSKIAMLRSLLSDYDYVCWIDADMLVIKTKIKLETLIELYLGNKHMMLSIDSGNQINTGFWILRNSVYTRQILDLIENLPELAGLYHEQGVLNNFYQKNLYNI